MTLAELNREIARLRESRAECIRRGWVRCAEVITKSIARLEARA